MAEDRGTDQARMVHGVVFEIERYALKDGPGIRSVVFLKGCSLHCLWCSNPESQNPAAQLVYWREKCLVCGTCVDACPRRALRLGPDGISIDHGLCDTCGVCEQVCNSEALVVMGREMAPQRILAEVLRDAPFYRTSGGGVTFSGGEPFEQQELLRETARLCRQNRIHVAVETSGMVDWQTMAECLPVIDLVLFDLKEMDSEHHKAYTGVDNQRVLENFTRLMGSGKAVIVRVPVIPQHNDRDDNFRRMIEFLGETAPGVRVDLLPYHRLGRGKYARLGVPYRLDGLEPPSRERIAHIQRLFDAAGFPTSVGG
jgi:pyruvate formate lyase activating enzyme